MTAPATIEPTSRTLAESPRRVASEAQREASRRNALKSTGPRSEVGKARSRANALRHGLTSRELLPDSMDAAADGVDNLAPGDWPRFLGRHLGVAMAQLDEVARIRPELRAVAGRRADEHWDLDRKVDAEKVAARLAASPSRALAELSSTRHGCELLIDRWSRLADSARFGAPWTPELADEARLLLGINRPCAHPAPLDRDGGPLHPDLDLDRGPERLAWAMVDDLRRRRDRLEAIDAAYRALAVANLGDAHAPELRRLNRYEADIHRRLRWIVDQARLESTEPLLGALEPDPAEDESRPEPESSPRLPQAQVTIISAVAIAAPRVVEVAPPIALDAPIAETKPIAETNIHEAPCLTRPHESVWEGEGRSEEVGQAPRSSLAGASPLLPIAKLAARDGSLDFQDKPMAETSDETKPNVGIVDETKPSVASHDETKPSVEASTSHRSDETNPRRRRVDPRKEIEKRRRQAARR